MVLKSDTKNFSYFAGFVQLAHFSLEAAEILNDTLQEFTVAKLKQQLAKIHEVEHTADVGRHELLNRLAKEFLPPIEREDIIRLAEEIDDVTDAIENVLINISIFNVQTIPTKINEFTEVIKDCCNSMIAALKEFENYKKSQTLHDEIVEVNRLEEVGDVLYRQSIQKLLQFNKDPFALVVWKEILVSLENCCNACEIVANDIENITLINS
ncbi:MAG TPA: DUF47 family protein [Oscillospiraceae bacterium]|nr:DUF47 family protein [Oscillospiraceae bacterium]